MLSFNYISQIKNIVIQQFLKLKASIEKGFSQNFPNFVAKIVKESNRWHAKLGHFLHFEF